VEFVGVNVLIVRHAGLDAFDDLDGGIQPDVAGDLLVFSRPLSRSSFFSLLKNFLKKLM